MITAVDRQRIGLKRQVVTFRGLSTDTKPVYQREHPKKAEFELDETQFYTKSGDTYTACSDGDSFYNLSATSRVDGTVTATLTSATFLGVVTTPGEHRFFLKAGTVTATAGDGNTGATAAAVVEGKADAILKLFGTTGTKNLTHDGTDWKISDTKYDLTGLVTFTGTPASGDTLAIAIAATWEYGGETVTLATYGLSVSGTITYGDVIVVGVGATEKELYIVCPLNGSSFYEMNTKKTYYFNEDGKAWVEG